MPKLDDIMKGGWHSERSGGSSSSTGGGSKSITGLNLRGKVPDLRSKVPERFSGYLGSQSSNTENPHEHVSRPLQSLRDPSTFGPPPKHVSYSGGTASPNRTTPDNRGLREPLSAEEIDANHATRGREAHQQAEEVEQPKYERGPFRVDTTGLSTTHLPPPPIRRDGAESRSPAPASARSQATRPKPSLPPRLPPRQNSNPGPSAPSPPPTYSNAIAEPPAHRGILNEGSLNRLGAAGISVPGFGIGDQKPPTSTRTSTNSPSRPGALSPPPAQAPARTGAGNRSQLDELQSRFSKFRTSSPAPSTPSSPSQGTSFAQKQAALRTASSFRKDPTSISLSDARNAASTANNFRERHGDQITAGWKSANNLNNKYGLADKVGQYNTTTPADDDVMGGPILMQDNTVVTKKKPPPPPKKKPGLGINADTGDGPPPLPIASKPKFNPDAHSSHPERMDLDLDLGSLWFAQTPATFPPPSISRLPGSRGYASSSGWSSDGVRKTCTFAGIIRHNADLSTTKIHLTWDGANPGLTVKAEQKHLPPPRHLTSSELENYREQYSDRVASWCEARMGQQVGNGECWTLAAEALKAIAAEERARGAEPCMTSQSVIHGSVIYSYLPPKPCEPRGGVEAAGVARGDIIQFLSAHFKRKDGRGESWAGAPDHTAIVTHVERGGLLRVVESNSGGVKLVKEGQYDFSELVNGEIRIFRVVGESWIRPLDPSWP